MAGPVLRIAEQRGRRVRTAERRVVADAEAICEAIDRPTVRHVPVKIKEQLVSCFRSSHDFGGLCCKVRLVGDLSA